MMSKKGYEFMNNYKSEKLCFMHWLKKIYDIKLGDFYDMPKDSQYQIRDIEFEKYLKEV